MKKFFSVMLAVVLLCVLALPCFAGNYGKMYDVYVPEGFTETLTKNGEIVYTNEKTGSTVDIMLSENNGRVYYIGADESAQKSFTEDFMSKLAEASSKKAEEKGYTVSYSDVAYSEKTLDFIKGFEITCKSTQNKNDGSKPTEADMEFYFFSTKDLIIQFQCRFMNDDDKKAAEKMISVFKMDGEVLTADNVMDSLPATWILIIPLALIVVIVAVIIVVKKNKKGSKDEQPQKADL